MGLYPENLTLIKSENGYLALPVLNPTKVPLFKGVHIWKYHDSKSLAYLLLGSSVCYDICSVSTKSQLPNDISAEHQI